MKTEPNDYINPTILSYGLTKREYFSAMCLQGVLSNHTACENLTKSGEGVDRFAVKCADALIAELNKESI